MRRHVPDEPFVAAAHQPGRDHVQEQEVEEIEAGDPEHALRHVGILEDPEEQHEPAHALEPVLPRHHEDAEDDQPQRGQSDHAERPSLVMRSSASFGGTVHSSCIQKFRTLW